MLSSVVINDAFRSSRDNTINHRANYWVHGNDQKLHVYNDKILYNQTPMKPLTIKQRLKNFLLSHRLYLDVFN